MKKLLLLLFISILITNCGKHKSSPNNKKPPEAYIHPTTTSLLSTREDIVNLATGNTFYVDSNHGNDKNSGNSKSPWKTITKAQTAVKPGDLVYLRSGNYGSFIDDFEITDRSNWIIYMSEIGAEVIFSHIQCRYRNPVEAKLIFCGIHIHPDYVDPASSGNEGCNDPQYSEAGGNTYAKSEIPFNISRAKNIKLFQSQIYGYNKHLTPDGINITNESQYIHIERVHIHTVRAGITYSSSSDLTFLYNKINNITSSFFRSGGDNKNVLIEGNHAFKISWAKTEDYCPRIAGHTYHDSFVSIRSNNVTIRNNVFRNGGSSSMIMFYGSNGVPAYHNILIENNLLYDQRNVTGIRINFLGEKVTIRNNTVVGRRRDDTTVDARQYNFVFQVHSLGEGYSSAKGLSVYNNIFVGAVNYGEYFSDINESSNIYWSAMKLTPNQVFLTNDDFTNKGVTFKLITTATNAPDFIDNYFMQNFFNESNLDFSWTEVEPYNAIGHGKLLDYSLHSNSDAINFGSAKNQPSTSLGSFTSDFFLMPDGKVRDENHHSAGAYEY